MSWAEVRSICGLVFVELLVVGLFLLFSFTLPHHLHFIAPPPPPFPLHPTGGLEHAADDGPIHWQAFAVFLAMVIFVLFLFAAHFLADRCKICMALLLAGVTMVGVGVAISYGKLWTRSTVEVRGARFTVGEAFINPKDTEKYGDNYARAIDENPGSFHKLWTEESITRNADRLGYFYVGTYCLLALALFMIGHFLLDNARGYATHTHERHAPVP